MHQTVRRLYRRGAENRAIAVDVEGAMLGPDCPLVEHTKEGYRSIGREEAAILQEFLFGDHQKCNWLFGQSRRIARALDQRDIARAQIFGLQIPIDVLDRESLTRLARAAPLIKASFNPDQPRIPAGNPGGGQWTTGNGTGGPSAVSAVGRDEASSRTRSSIIPAQLTVPWDFPIETPWKVPNAPTEITPIPFDFPGAERKPPPLPTNPFPRDPECAEEWAAAYDYCYRMQRQGKFRPGYSGPGKDMRTCLLGQVSERCGGNPTA